jgi:hypothetical protein
MTSRVGISSRRLATLGALVLIAGAFCALGATRASAAETTPSAASATAPTAVQQLQQGPLLAFSCNDCHAQIKDDLLPGITFKHGAHMTYDCTACHPRFPHTRAGTERPVMASCFSCHGLRHGPQGIVASEDCATCHTKPRSQLLPKDHIGDWNGKGHVAPSKTGLRTSCMMCHTKAQCDACHVKANVSWETTLTYTYDAGNGCLSCHKSALPRLAAPVTASTLDASAHRDLTCGQCHPDFRYDDQSGATKLWNVNAGLACGAAGCHPKERAAWATSVHGTAVLSGSDLTAATCGGCHGGHDIERLKTQAAKDRLRLSGATTCVGSCHTHQAAAASYADWWHGSAYRAGSLDAPACWTCHGAHETKAIKDPRSATSPEMLPKTCGQAGCHGGATESFVEQWRTLAHGRPATVADNPIVAFRASLSAGGR